MSAERSALRAGIIGLGRAGLARVKALRALGVPISIIASKRGPRDLSELSDTQGLGTVDVVSARAPRWSHDWREVISDQETNLILICSENRLHDEQARAALSAGKHVWVEFPLTPTAARAAELFALADRHDRQLHVEVIGTLTARHAWARAQAQAGVVTRWNADFSGRLYRWVTDDAVDDLAPLLAFGRIYQAVDLFGPLQVSRAELTRSTSSLEGAALTSLRLCVDLKSEEGVIVNISETRRVDARRASDITLYDAAGDPLILDQELTSPNAKPAPRPLFEQDARHALSMLCGDPHGFIADYATRDKLLSAHRACDQIVQALQES